MSPNYYVKAIIGVISAVLAAITAALADNTISSSEWVNVGIAFVGACAVFAAPNVPGAKYTKAILAGLTAVLTIFSSGITDGFSVPELIQSVITILGAVGIYALRNSVPTNEEVADLRRGRHERAEEA